MHQLIPVYKERKKNEQIDILFVFQAGTVWSSWDSIYHLCTDDSRFSVKLALDDEDVVDKAHLSGAESFLKARNITYVFFKDIDFESYCPHVVFIQFPYDMSFHAPRALSIRFVQMGARVVYVPYGIEIADTEISRHDHFHNFVVENAWRIYTSCDAMKNEYDKYCRNRHAVKALGSPKFDGIYAKSSYILPPIVENKFAGRKIVVWKMHFPKNIIVDGRVKQITPELGEYVSFANCIDEYDSCFFIVLPHPKMIGGVVSSDVKGNGEMMNQVNSLFNILRGKENVYIDLDEEYRNSFFNAEAIIMDRSGLIVEAAMLDVPVLLLQNADYVEPLTPPIKMIANCFEHGNSVNDIKRFVNDICSGVDRYSEKRRNTVSEVFPFLDGKCGARIVEDIVRGLQVEQVRPKVAFYGSGDVCNYYMRKYHWNEELTFEIVAVADSDSKKWGSNFYGRNIIAPEDLINVTFDVLVITTEPHYYDIKKYLVYELFLDERKIWRMDDFVMEIGLCSCT